MNWNDLTDEQRSDVLAQAAKREARRQARDLVKAANLGRLAATQDKERAFLDRLAAREYAAGRL